jgi:hypothetical protein
LLVAFIAYTACNIQSEKVQPHVLWGYENKLPREDFRASIRKR